MSLLKFRNKVIEAIVFDLDGTLIHSSVDFRRMRERLFSELGAMGVPASVTDPTETIVSNVERSAAFLISAGRGGDVEGLRRSVGRLMDLTEMERVHETVAVDGASECIDLLRSAGSKVGILTRGSRAYATAALHYADLHGRFDAMVCRDDHPEEEAKPNGLAMRRVASLLNVRTDASLLVGDHLIDMTCARSSGASFVGVLSGAFKRPDWEKHGQVELISSVAELPALLGIGKL